MDQVDFYGTPGGVLVIALHGAAANRKTWLPLARSLPTDFELWAPDLPGHGSRRDETFTREASLATIETLLAAARERPVVIAGDSLGGYLALEAGARVGDGLAGVVAGGCTWTMTGLAGALARASDLPPALVERIVGSARFERLFEALVSRVTPRDVGCAILDAGLRSAARSESLRELRGFDVAAMVANVRAPLTFVNGRFDWPTRAGERTYARLARGGAVVIAPDCGHGVGLFAPEIFARAIVATHARGAPSANRREERA